MPWRFSPRSLTVGWGIYALIEIKILIDFLRAKYRTKVLQFTNTTFHDINFSIFSILLIEWG